MERKDRVNALVEKRNLMKAKQKAHKTEKMKKAEKAKPRTNSPKAEKRPSSSSSVGSSSIAVLKFLNRPGRNFRAFRAKFSRSRRMVIIKPVLSRYVKAG